VLRRKANTRRRQPSSRSWRNRSRPIRAIWLLGLLQLETGKLDEAGKTLSRVVGTPGDSAIVHYHLGLLAAAAGDWLQSVAEARAAPALAPDSTLSRLLLAIGLLRTNQSAEVGTVLAPVLKANPVEIGSGWKPVTVDMVRADIDDGAPSTPTGRSTSFTMPPGSYEMCCNTFGQGDETCRLTRAAPTPRWRRRSTRSYKENV
jgi:hypothetical protein